MKAYRLEHSAQLCRHLLQTRVVYAPVADGADVHWQKISQAVELTVPPERPLFSPKQFLFAEREPLFVFDAGRFVETLPQLPALALFGVTACDLTAIAYQDQFFATDPYYQKRRAALLLVGVDCTRPCAGAFCHTMDAGPSVRANTADLVLCPEAAGGYTLLAETQRGEAALHDLALPQLPETWRVRRKDSEAEAVQHMSDASHIEAGIGRINAGTLTAETWEQLGLQCVSCAGCTTVCPTCSCFAMREQQNVGAEGFTRERVWDSCLLEGFAREASGHHPARAAGQRVERFFRHKLSDDFRVEFGRYGCVGCGRCDTVCPGSIGAHSTLRRLAAS